MLLLYPLKFMATDPLYVSSCELSGNETNEPVFNGSLIDVDYVE